MQMLMYSITSLAMKNSEWEALDVLSVINFLLGWFNFIENLDQTSVQDVIEKALDEIHEHLEQQDNKIDEIIYLLGGEDDEKQRTSTEIYE